MTGMRPPAIRVVAGAPGSGKSTAVAACLAMQAPLIFLDMDWLLDASGALAGTDIRFASKTWPAYNRLWSEVLAALARNHNTPVLFAPGMLDGVPAENHVHLDCAAPVRRERLAARRWDQNRMAEALEDAAELRRDIPGTPLDSARLSPNQIAARIIAWATPPA